MSVVVRMEMPKNCIECPFSIIDDIGVWCNAITNNVYGYGKRDEDCPIVCALPEGHARLVDADDVNNHIMGYVDLRDCPTIVPAEGSETCLD